jgi:primosomal protein N' (replication factor Y)
MSRYVDVLPNPGRALSQLFTYHVPEPLQSALRVGAQVLVPFGPRIVVGVVARLRDDTDRQDLKDVEAVLEDVPVLPDEAFPLARWMADRYLCQLGDALRAFLPEGMNYRAGRAFHLTAQPIPDSIRADLDAGPVVEHLESAGSQVRLPALRRLLPGKRLTRALRLLKSRNLIAERATLRPPRARKHQVRLVEVAVTPQELASYCRERAAKAPAQAACLRAAADGPPAPAADLARRAGVSTSTVQALLKKGLLRARWTPVRRKPWRDVAVEAGPPPELTPEQRSAVAEIAAALEAPRSTSFLLFGVTASGKTEVFLRAIESVLDRDRQAIVLMPEISLTAQALGIYRARFGDQVAILHSRLSVGERWDEWQRIRTGEAGVIVGARSALFAPTRALGLIVVDEEHETSYKQDQAPRYRARDAALKRGELVQCPVVLASATPSLESFYAAQRGRHRLLRLPTRVEERPLPRVRIVDMRGAASRPGILSTPLRQAIAGRLRSGEQIILFHNRRGFATFLLCPTCGQALRCPNCGVALKYHRQRRQVRCHHCGLTRPAPDICSRCGSHQIRFSGFGTERVERELQRIFPQAKPGRMDQDTTARKGAHVRIVRQFRTAETNILIGTQMVAKGFDFPGVTLVGVISADTSLNLPDFRAAERTFQLLTQVSGRSGRGEKEGDVVVQTFLPDDYSIQAASHHDYEAFYRREIETRRELNYPPFSQIVNSVASAERESDASRLATSLADALRLRAEGAPVEILGPAPAPLVKLRGRYRWHVLARGEEGEVVPVVRDVVAGLGHLEPGALIVDVDPVSLM